MAIKSGNIGIASRAKAALGDIYYKAGDYENAELFYSQGIEKSGDNKETADLRFNLAQVLEARGEFEASCSQYLAAAELYTQSPELSSRSLLRAAKLYEDKEDFQSALKVYNRIMQKGSGESKFAEERVEWIKSNLKK
jgi:tetratricopeptide (TPR) repeat protein